LDYNLLLSNVVSPLLFNLSSKLISGGPDIWKTFLLMFKYSTFYMFVALLYTSPVFQCPVSNNDYIPVLSIATVA